ncbi:protein CbbY [Paraburkholderia hospita]|uniref:Protein CbbY n=1 Tax=Paraburkholderia hospita TaxID=169430 RepID=A0ABN0F410_9BURK|nr:HAD family hydrolase [Paraburkholderia hospita]EIM93317.1 protein CbbY [Paraburkholderia hospita]OUL77821.1 protein CbbY [Paraburkholderia hospita]
MEALIFDVDGTLAETEAAHLNAFNSAFVEVGLDWYWDEALYTRLLQVAGGKERLLHYWTIVEPEEARGRKVKDIVDAVHAVKTRLYTEHVGRGLPLRPGVRRLIDEANAAGMPVAIATTTTPANLDALLRPTLGADWRERFAIVCDAGTSPVKKPASDVYFDVLRHLNLCGADCFAVEDSDNGLRSALGAGVPTLVTQSVFTLDHRFDGAVLVLPSLGDPEHPIPQHLPGAKHSWVDLDALKNWHRGTLFEAA